MDIETVRKIFNKLDILTGLFILKTEENEVKRLSIGQKVYRSICCISIFCYVLLLTYTAHVYRYNTLEFLALLTDLITYMIMMLGALKFYFHRLEFIRILEWCFAQYNGDNFHTSVQINARIRFEYAQRVLVKYIKVLTGTCAVDWCLLFIMYPVANYQESKFTHETPLDMDIPLIGSKENWAGYLVDYYLQAFGDYWFLVCASFFFGIFTMVYFTITAYMDTIVWVIIKMKRELESELITDENEEDDQNGISLQPKRMAWAATRTKIKLIAAAMKKKNQMALRNRKLRKVEAQPETAPTPQTSSNAVAGSSSTSNVITNPTPGTSRDSDPQEGSSQSTAPRNKTLNEWLTIVIEMICNLIEVYSAYTRQLSTIVLLFEITVFLSNFVLGLTVLLASEDVFMFIDLMFLNVILLFIAWVNDIIQDKLRNINNAFYGLPWYAMNTKDRKLTLNALHVMNQRVGLSAAGFHYLSRKIFARIIFISYAYCLIIRSIIVYRRK